ncbi:Golgi apparatus protein 1 [Pieris napi]|uniref:Golgi apparatus protein 1 n=1 Tax=Pieris napi TaxID=78633 RepID=UPI001FBAEDDC|nr:Golgi apparatus protein 1 [Pieris napi]XP_047506858.1 Golgi apparatus protein 1 [Pieris napi]
MHNYFNIWSFLFFDIFLCALSAQHGTLKSSIERYKEDLRDCGPFDKQCSHLDEDLALLSCSINITRSNKTQLPFICQHKIWLHQLDLHDNNFLETKLKEACLEEPIILDCLNSIGNIIDCVLKRKPSVNNKLCLKTISKIEVLMFNDWQITNTFVKNCYDDIQALSCGRIPPDPKTLSQMHTLRCIQNHEQNLRPECQSEITSLEEIKYNSLQLDKLVFAVCNIDQRNFCPDEVPGSLLMYKCLIRHKYENGMTKRCQDQLFYAQRNIVLNYKMSKGLVKSCKEDIRKYHCRKGVVDDKDVRLAQILLCLENVARNGTVSLAAECVAEMTDHRKMLMDDYRLSPELMQSCANDITILCKGVEGGGKTIHCLMEHARPRKRKERRISATCQKSLEILVQEANPGEDWRVDPILRKACKPIVDKACGEVNGGNGRVMSCLMEKLGTALMSAECETALIQIQYFISRDFKLDPQLYRACRYDAVTQCKAKLQWADASEHQSQKDPLILPCLYNYAYDSELKGILQPACEQQIRRVMRQRAVSVDLLPEIADTCMDELANLCYENTGKGEEIQCLQSKIKELSSKCKEVVTNFTETQSGHIELNAIVGTNCRVPIEKLCSSELKSKSDDDEVLDCLIRHKNDPEIKANLKCRAAIEHEQLISLKNYRFTRKFKNACKSYVVRFCPKAQTKSQVVTCLSEIVRNDTISKRKHTIYKECRQQLRSQLFQQKENVDLDPELKEACKKDLNAYCSNIPHGESAALECLQTAKSGLSAPCKKAIFVVRKQEFTDNAIDYHLITTCSDMIDLYCHNTEPTVLLDCLKAHRDETDFNKNCKYVVTNRMIEQNLDYRFNNNLQNACKGDIRKYCSPIILNEPQDIELQGKVLYCLKEKFRELKLEKTCENELANVLKEQALNYRLDPLLGKLCKAEIQTICAIPNDSITNSDGQVEECLKNALLNHKIVSAECAREVVQIIEETEVDIEADPLLERACALDLLKYCKDLEHGAGRRLKCLKIILNDSSRKLETECQKELSSRLEMYRYVAAVNVVENIGDVYNEISSSPSKKYFLVVGFSIIGLIFIFGLYCGRITKRAMYVKRK